MKLSLQRYSNTVPILKKHAQRHVTMLSSILLLGATLWLGGCQKTNEADPKSTLKTVDAIEAEVALKWADLTLKLIRTTSGFTPPVASRALGYAGVTLYESVAPGTSNYQSLVGQLNQLSNVPKAEVSQEYEWAIVANAGQAAILKNLFANTTLANKTTIDSLETALNAAYKTTEISLETFDRSVKFGRDVATSIFEWSKTDNGHEGYLRNQPKDYVPPVGVGLWVQTTAGDAGRAMQPYWGLNRPFVGSNTAVIPPAPLKYSTDISSPFFTQGLEVYSVGKNLTDEQKTIALFWADGGNTITPPGHSYSLTSIAIKKANAKLDKAAEAYAKVGISVADAFICCWKCKYQYNLMRPVTYINSAIDPNWKPLIATPPFPDYLSGHSTQSGAFSQVLSDLFGYNFSFADNTHEARGFKARSFSNFYDAADEAAISRLYGGIHYRAANEIGLSEGRKLGRNVSSLKFKK